MEAADIDLVKRLGLEASMKKLAENATVLANLKQVAEAAGLASTGCDKAIGNSLLSIANGVADAEHRRFIAGYVASGKFAVGAQVVAAIDFVKKLKSGASISVPDFEAASGAGIKFSDADITSHVSDLQHQIGPARWKYIVL
jgi:hypothetical protein